VDANLYGQIIGIVGAVTVTIRSLERLADRKRLNGRNDPDDSAVHRRGEDCGCATLRTDLNALEGKHLDLAVKVGRIEGHLGIE
jgi:hypothetical protein